MKISLVCQTIEPGRSGVGDYTWRLAGALQSLGHETNVVSFWDSFVESKVSGQRHRGKSEVRFLRLPANSDGGAVAARMAFADFKPDLISLQFVPFSFHPRGFVNGRRFPFSQNKVSKRHLMVHETWIGEHPGAALMARGVGILQKFLCRWRIRQWQPDRIHTSCELYAERLSLAGIPATILPMFGTIEPSRPDGRNTVREQLMTEHPKLRDVAMQGLRWLVLFGTIYDAPQVAASLCLLEQEAQRMGTRLVVLIAGCPQNQKDQLTLELSKFGVDTLLLPMPRLDDTKLSQLFQAMDFGMTATPLDGIGKSSAAASMRDHGLAVLCPSRGAYQANSQAPFYWAEDFIEQGLLERPPGFPLHDRVHHAAQQLVEDLGA
jgi:hypothetical protein